jgi:Holliday junction resolvase RusA-like endonuclease
MPKSGAGDVIQRFEIPLPPSVNAMYANAPGKGRIKTAKYKSWKTDAGWILRMQKPRKTLSPVAVTIAMRRPSASSDLDNRFKATIDLLTGIVLGDDKQVIRITGEWADVEGAVVTVEEVAP